MRNQCCSWPRVQNLISYQPGFCRRANAELFSLGTEQVGSVAEQIPSSEEQVLSYSCVAILV